MRSVLGGTVHTVVSASIGAVTTQNEQVRAELLRAIVSAHELVRPRFADDEPRVLPVGRPLR